MPNPAQRSIKARPSVAKKLLPLGGAALLALVACGGGGGSAGPGPTPPPGPSASPSPGKSPNPIPSPTATSNPVGPALILSANSLAFTAAGPGAATAAISATQATNTNGFTLSTTTCSGIVGVSPASGAGPFTFSPLAAGTCVYVVNGIDGVYATVSISVTTTTVGSQ
jgi:hypothetical protein